jgi:uncharacterized protein RhaS with RHS repeats
MKNRHYDAVAGRFVQRDPAGYDGGMNLYGYANDNPINFVDREGLSGGTPEEEAAEAENDKKRQETQARWRRQDMERAAEIRLQELLEKAYEANTSYVDQWRDSWNGITIGRRTRVPVKTMMERVVEGVKEFYFPKHREFEEKFGIEANHVSTGIKG